MTSGSRWLIAALFVGSAVWAAVGSSWIFPQLSANSDEGIYLLQADTLLDGDLTPAAPATHAEAFVPWFAAIEDGHYVLKYTPVHAAVVASGDLLPGPDRLALGVIAVAQLGALAALAAELGLTGRARVAALALFALSPLVLQLEITYLPYGTSLALGMAALASVLRGLRLRALGWGLVGGFAWGLALFARPYDGVLLLAVIAASAWSGPADRRDVVRTAAAGALGAAVPLAAFLAFNAAVTGDAFQLPFNLLEPADRLGFGDRRALPSDAFIEFGPAESIAALGRNLLLVVAWTGGGLVAIALAGWALVQRRFRTAPVVAMLIIWPLGYALFWGSYLTAFVWDGALFLGPYYYLPLIPMLCIAAAAGWEELQRFHPRTSAGALVAMAALSLFTLLPALRDQIDRSSQREEMAEALATNIDSPALVFLPPVYGAYLQNPFSFLRNTPDLDGPIVYALAGNDARDAQVMDMFPERSPYRVRLPRGWSDQPEFEPLIEIEPIT